MGSWGEIMLSTRLATSQSGSTFFKSKEAWPLDSYSSFTLKIHFLTKGFSLIKFTSFPAISLCLEAQASLLFSRSSYPAAVACIAAPGTTLMSASWNSALAPILVE